MKKIAIVTWFNSGKNYGQTLQAYALYQKLTELGYETEILSYRTGIFSRYRLLSAVRKYRYLKNDILQQRFDQFIKKNIKTSRMLRNKREVERYISFKGFDAVICGSDQIWNPYNFDEIFFLGISNKVNKIAYAPSIADIRHADKFREYPEIKKLLQGLVSVSAREKTGAEMIEHISGIRPVTVLDPALLFYGNEWESMISLKKPPKGRYAFCYMFGMTEKQMEFIIKDCRKLGCRKLYISDILSENTEDKMRMLQMLSKEVSVKMLYNISIETFLGTIHNADFIYTDSFHGMAFSILFHRQFYVFDNGKKETDDKYYNIDRMYTLLEKTGLESRLADAGKAGPASKSRIDYGAVDRKLKQERTKSIQFLKDAIEKKPVRITERACTGCGACANACPVGCIEMTGDRNGFPYPVILNSKCTACGKCIKTCPLNAHIQTIQQKGYDKKIKLFYDRDIQKRCQATSGGAFGCIAEWVLEQKGVVFGAGYDKSFFVEITYVENIEDLHRLKKSKYVQAFTGDSYTQAKYFLRQGRLVFFTGTPCQVAGLKSYLGDSEYENLYTADIICHGVPSPQIYRKWLDDLEKKSGSKITKIDFRSKKWRA